MKYLSLDLETTGLVRHPDNILQIAAVVEDVKNHKPLEELPRWVCFVKHENYTGSAYALHLNSWVFGHILNPKESPYPVLDLNDALTGLTEFVKENFGEEKPYLAGANVGTFGIQFFPDEIKRLFHDRTIEAGSVLIDWNTGPRDISPECDHDALNDSLLVIKKLRESYPKTLDLSFLPESRLRQIIIEVNEFYHGKPWEAACIHQFLFRALKERELPQTKI